jgi:hypothetical protein
MACARAAANKQATTPIEDVFLNGHRDTATRQPQSIGSFKGPHGVVLGPNFRELYAFFSVFLRTARRPVPYRCDHAEAAPTSRRGE